MRLKFSLSPDTMFRTHNIACRKLYLLFLNIVKRGKEEKHKIVQIAVFPTIFVNDCLKNLQNLKWGILKLLLLSQIEGMHLPITSLLYKP